MTVCAVSGCKSSNDKRRIKDSDNVVEVSFCRFPRDEKLRKVWLYLCGREEDCKAKRLFVCMKHFALEDYVRNLRHELLNYYPKSSRKIKIDSIPTLFLPPNVVIPPRKTPIVESPKAKPPIRTYLKKDKNLTPQNNPTIIVQPDEQSPQTNLNKTSDFDNKSKPIEKKLQETQFEFIDHVLMAYLNRCRSRAGNINVCMPHYILKRKAQEASLLLGAPDRYHWFDKFKKKVAENDAKGIVLSATPESLSIADIINDEWPKFAEMKGLDIGDDGSEETLSALDEEKDSMQTENVTINCDEDQTTQSKEPEPNVLRSQSPPVVEEICEDVSQRQTPLTKNSLNVKVSDNTQDNEFLKHVLKVFIRRFNATWPQADIPDIILNAKFREAAMLLGSKIKNRNVWLSAFKLSIKQKSFLNEITLTEPNQSLHINDIIEEEWPKFNVELVDDMSSEAEGKEVNDLQEVIACETNIVDKVEQNNIESSDMSIQTYEEARDCLNLLNNYALELGDLSALSLIQKVDSYLRSKDCEE